MDDSVFDPEIFLQGTIEDEFETEFTPVEPGDYQAAIVKVGSNSGNGTNGPWAVFNVTWGLNIPGSDDDGRQVRQSIFLDLTDDGRLATGKNKNVQLGKLLDALGLKGQPWSPQQLEGRPATVNVENRVGEGKYEGQTFSEVKKVAMVV